MLKLCQNSLQLTNLEREYKGENYVLEVGTLTNCKIYKKNMNSCSKFGHGFKSPVALKTKVWEEGKSLLNTFVI